MKDIKPSLLKRPEYYFEIPDDVRGFPEKDVKSFKIRAYTLAQEIDAARAAKLSGESEISMTSELIRRSVFEINGQPVTDFNWLDEQSPAVRALLGLALSKATAVKNEAVDAFLASMKVEA